MPTRIPVKRIPIKVRLYARRYRSDHRLGIRYPAIVVVPDNWNDFGYNTLFAVKYFENEESEVDLGFSKIAVGPSAYSPESFESDFVLPESAYSLGQSVAFYRRIRDEIRPARGRKILSILSDVVAQPFLRIRYDHTEVWEKSLVRDLSARHALIRGGYYIGTKYQRKRPPKFTLTMKLDEASGPHVVNFNFERHRGIPHRINLLVGRNGTGKTTCLAALACALAPDRNQFQGESVKNIPESVQLKSLSQVGRVIAVSYNAFDEFPLPLEPNWDEVFSSHRSSFSYKYCGLRNLQGQVDQTEIAKMFFKSLDLVNKSDRLKVWGGFLEALVGKNVHKVALSGEKMSSDFFYRLSAGQRLVVALVTDIVGFIEEGSLLLIEEPETHLHPGLLTSLISILSKY